MLTPYLFYLDTCEAALLLRQGSRRQDRDGCCVPPRAADIGLAQAAKKMIMHARCRSLAAAC